MGASVACSFCGRARPDVRVVVQGLNGAICNQCAKWADSEHATVAHCAACTVRNGEHEVSCPEWGRGRA
jgi:ATP-dependent protease Clp ATPase subunit